MEKEKLELREPKIQKIEVKAEEASDLDRSDTYLPVMSCCSCSSS